MFRNVFAFVVVASALALTGCSKCSEQPAAEAPVEAATEAAPADAAAPAGDASMEAAPAADATMEAAPAATPAP